MQLTALLPAQERLLAVVLPRLPGPASTPRWATQPTPCPIAKDAAAMATEGVEDWAEPRVSKKGCLDTPRDRGAHACCRVSVSAPVPACASGVFSTGLFLYFKSFTSFESKPSRNPGKDSRKIQTEKLKTKNPKLRPETKKLKTEFWEVYFVNF